MGALFCTSRFGRPDLRRQSRQTNLSCNFTLLCGYGCAVCMNVQHRTKFHVFFTNVKRVCTRLNMIERRLLEKVELSSFDCIPTCSRCKRRDRLLPSPSLCPTSFQSDESVEFTLIPRITLHADQQEGTPPILRTLHRLCRLLARMKRILCLIESFF